MADQSLAQELLDLVQQASHYRQLRKGANEGKLSLRQYNKLCVRLTNPCQSPKRSTEEPPNSWSLRGIPYPSLYYSTYHFCAKTRMFLMFMCQVRLPWVVRQVYLDQSSRPASPRTRRVIWWDRYERRKIKWKDSWYRRRRHRLGRWTIAMGLCWNMRQQRCVWTERYGKV